MYDKQPLEGGANYGGGGFKLREIVLAIVSGVALIACVVFLGLYAHKKSTDNTDNNVAITLPMVMTTTTTPKPPTPKTCDTSTCLETTAYVRSLMNVSVDPCKDFFSYACGYWPSQNPLEPNHYYNDVRDKIYHDNQEKLRNLLDSPKLRDVPWGAERKAKDMYSSCIDEYGRGVASGKAFIDKVLKNTGDWYVLNDGFNPNTWDLLSFIEKVHVDFWTDVLFKVQVTTDWSNRTQRVITLRSGGLGMPTYYYTMPFSSYNKTRMDYRAYVRKVGSLLARDYGLTMDNATDARLDTYVDDVMQVETMLASISRRSPYSWRNSFKQNRRVKISDISSVFDWVSFFGYMFDKSMVNGNTRIVIPQQQYLRRMATAITNLGPNKNRMLNNYFTWQMALTYINDLSSEYIHAGRQYRNDRYGVTEFPSTWEYCFGFVAYQMDEAMSHLYIQGHFAVENKQKVHEIADYVKRALLSNIANMNFMDDKTRQYAISKVKATVDRFGYPDYLLKTDEIDLIYASLEVHNKDYFQNVLNLNKFKKVDLNNYLNEQLQDRTRWGINAYWTFISVRQTVNQLAIPAGMLQHPIYDYNLPHYLNFGSIGSLIANAYVQTIGTTGSRYAKDGTRFQDSDGNNIPWWTNATLNKYTPGHDCLANFYINKTLGTYVNPFSLDSTTYTATVNEARALAFGDYAATELGGVKQAYYAYKLWLKENGPEQKSPIIKLSNDQMYFIAYAQTKCYVWSDITRYLRYRYGRLPDSMGVNGAVSQLKEFAQAFQCSADAPLNPPDKCMVF